MQRDIVLTVSTFPTREMAHQAARGLVEKRLAACVQITSPVTSIYTWKGEVNEDAEVLLFTKSTAANARKVIDFIKNGHPYEVPEIITVPIIDGWEGYIDWVKASAG